MRRNLAVTAIGRQFLVHRYDGCRSLENYVEEERSKMLQKERGTLECYPRKPALAKLTVFTLVGLVLRDELMSN